MVLLVVLVGGLVLVVVLVMIVMVGVAVGGGIGGVCRGTAETAAHAAGAGAAGGGSAVTVRIVCPAGRLRGCLCDVIYHCLMCEGHMVCSCPSLQFRAVEDHLQDSGRG